MIETGWERKKEKKKKSKGEGKERKIGKRMRRECRRDRKNMK